MDAAPSSSVDTPATKAAHAATRLSVAVAVVLIAMKAFALGASGSVSMLASLTDSALDLAASLTTYFAVRWAAQPADDDHRFGHGKGEALSALVQAGLIFASSLFVGWEAILRMFDPRPVTAGGWSLGVILVSMALTAWLVWRQSRAIRESGSIAVTADRAHYAADLAASVVVLIGIASGVWLRAPGLDAAAGLIVAVWLAWGAFGLLKSAGDVLLDRTAPDADRIAVTTALLGDPRVGGVHRLRVRRVGPRLVVQAHIDLDGGQTLEQAHAVLEGAEARVKAAFPDADVILHPDPRSVAASLSDDSSPTSVPVA